MEGKTNALPVVSGSAWGKGGDQTTAMEGLNRRRRSGGVGRRQL